MENRSPTGSSERPALRRRIEREFNGSLFRRHPTSGTGVPPVIPNPASGIYILKPMGKMPLPLFSRRPM